MEIVCLGSYSKPNTSILQNGTFLKKLRWVTAECIFIFPVLHHSNVVKGFCQYVYKFALRKIRVFHLKISKFCHYSRNCYKCYFHKITKNTIYQNFAQFLWQVYPFHFAAVYPSIRNLEGSLWDGSVYASRFITFLNCKKIQGVHYCAWN